MVLRLDHHLSILSKNMVLIFIERSTKLALRHREVKKNTQSHIPHLFEGQTPPASQRGRYSRQELSLIQLYFRNPETQGGKAERGEEQSFYKKLLLL